MINLGDLAMLDAGWGLFAGRLEAADDTDADVIFAADTDDANGLIADSHSGNLVHQGVNFGVIDIRGRAAGQMGSRTCLRAKSFWDDESKREPHNKKSQYYFFHDASMLEIACFANLLS